MQPLISQFACIFRIAPSQGQSPALALVELHTVDDCPALESVTITLQGHSTLEGVTSASQFSITLLVWPTQNTFKSCTRVVYENIEKKWTENGALGNPTSGWPAA